MTGAFASASEAETLALAARFAADLLPGDAVALRGPLGAGKTLFCRGVLLGLGGKDEAASPSYALVHEYPARLPVFHMDLYRLAPGANWEDLEEIGLGHYFGGGGVCLVEWPERLPESNRPFRYEVEIEVAGKTERRLRIRETT